MNVWWRNLLSPELWTKFGREAPLFLKIPEFSCKTAYRTGQRKPQCKNISSIRSSVSIELPLVTDTDNSHTHYNLYSRASRRAGKNENSRTNDEVLFWIAATTVYASAILATTVYPAGRLSVRLSQAYDLDPCT